MKVLAISGSLRSGSYNSLLLEAAQEQLPAGVEVEVWGGLREVPPYDQDDDVQEEEEQVEEFREFIENVRPEDFAQ